MPEIPADLPPPNPWQDLLHCISPLLDDVMSCMRDISKSEASSARLIRAVALYAQDRVAKETAGMAKEIEELKAQLKESQRSHDLATDQLKALIVKNQLLDAKYEKVTTAVILALWKLISLPHTDQAAYLMPAIGSVVSSLKKAGAVNPGDA